jgi:Uma2 family endonuclease
MSVAEFEDLVASGEFDQTGQRIDLIRGELRVMSPAGPDHSDITTYLEEWSEQWVKRYGFRKRSEKSILIPGLESVPEPDIVWVKRRRYRKAHPTAADVGLVIEVSDSSLSDDRKQAALYAEAGIQEYWIVNCIDEVVEVYREPLGNRYQDKFVVPRGKHVHPIVGPEALLDVADMFADEYTPPTQ